MWKYNNFFNWMQWSETSSFDLESLQGWACIAFMSLIKVLENDGKYRAIYILMKNLKTDAYNKSSILCNIFTIICIWSLWTSDQNSKHFQMSCIRKIYRPLHTSIGMISSIFWSIVFKDFFDLLLSKNF